MSTVMVDTVHPVRIVPVEAKPTIVKCLGTPVYYKEEPSVSASNNTGELLIGETLSVGKPSGVWFIAKTGGALLEAEQASIIGEQALLGTDGTIGGPGGSPLSSAIVKANSQPATAPGVPWVINVKDGAYGAKGDGKIVTDAAIAVNSKIVTSKQAEFKETDVGKIIAISGASTALGEVRHLTIAKYISPEKVEISGEASKETTAAEAIFGTNDGPALTAAMAAAPTYKYSAGVLPGGPGAVVYAPAAIYVTTEEWVIKNRVILRGDGFGQTIFAPVTGEKWINEPEQGSTKPWTEGGIEKIQIRATWAYSQSGTYEAGLKVLNIAQAKKCTVKDNAIIDAPATAFPFDQCQEGCLIEGNFAINAGRLNSGTEPGGSGFGMGTADKTKGEQTPTTVTGNFAIKCKRYGIFNEGQKGGTPATSTQGFRFTNNYCAECKVGIGSSGGMGTIIQGNTCVKNTQAGIALDAGTLTTEEKGYMPPQGLVTGNVCIENTEDGIRLDGSQNEQAQWNDVVDGNICAYNGLRGVSILAASVNISGLKITNNTIAFNLGSGLWASYPTGTTTAKFTNSVIANNLAYNNATGEIVGNVDGIKIEVKCQNMTVDNNRCFDTAGTGGKQEHGILILGGFEGGSFRGNDIRGNKKESQIVFSGTQPNTAAAISGNLGYTAQPAPASVTVTASPMTYKGKLIPEWLFIVGGVVTSVTLGGVQVASATNVVIPVESGDEPVTTYSSAPTMWTRKR